MGKNDLHDRTDPTNSAWRPWHSLQEAAGWSLTSRQPTWWTEELEDEALVAAGFDVEPPAPVYRKPGIWALVWWLFWLRVGAETLFENAKYVVGWVIVAVCLWKILQWSVVRRKIRETEVRLVDEPLPRLL